MPTPADDPTLAFTPEQIASLRARLPRLAEKVVAAIMEEVPSYSVPFQGRMGRTIEMAVALALDGFLDMAATVEADGAGPANRPEQVFAAAYQLGRGEARAGRSMDALAAAYRIGTATSWRELSRTAVEHGLPAEGLVRFAELVFDYLDQLSAVSVAGHAEELAREGRLRERHLAQLAVALIGGREEERLVKLAEQANWRTPAQLTAVVLPQVTAGTVRPRLDARTLELAGDVEALEEWPDHVVLLAPGSRPAVLRALAGTVAVIGPTVAWTAVSGSFNRALRALALGLADDEAGQPLDTETHLATLVVRADPVARADLRARVLAPLDDLREAQREKLVETLGAWLLHQGRRDEIAASLFVHPQTIRYRMGQLREVFGDQLDDPAFVREATIALA